MACVDGSELDRDGAPLRHSLDRAEAGHASQRHKTELTPRAGDRQVRDPSEHPEPYDSGVLRTVSLILSLAPEPGAEPVESPPGDDSVVELEAAPPRARRFMLGLEAVGLQVPPLQGTTIRFDRRFVGSTSTMAGLGLLGRFTPDPIVSIELGVRSGSARYQDSDRENTVSHDMVLTDLGLVLWLARGRVGQIGLDVGAGGAFNSVRYLLHGDDETSRQTFGTGFIRVGGSAELSARRFAFLFSVRAYGVMTDRASRNRGPLFEDDDGALAPVTPLQTIVVGTLGVGYRF
jgi:hypothetical protein